MYTKEQYHAAAQEYRSLMVQSSSGPHSSRLENLARCADELALLVSENLDQKQLTSELCTRLNRVAGTIQDYVGNIHTRILNNNL